MRWRDWNGFASGIDLVEAEVGAERVGEASGVRLRDGTVSVRDHGPGFHEQDLEHVFDRFYRADDARRLPGSGLGLAIVKQAVDAHHGKAVAINATEGGALVEVSFGAPT
jgi:two-component system sensor histidine kinase MprB